MGLQTRSGILPIIHEFRFGLGFEILPAASVCRRRNLEEKGIEYLYRNNSKDRPEETAEEAPEEKKE